MKNIFKSGLILAIIACISGGMIVGVYKLTYKPYVFSLTPADNTAISEITSSTKFGRLDVGEDPYVRYVLRVLDGADKDNYIIRSFSDARLGIIEVNLLIDGTDGTIKDIAFTSISSSHDRFYMFEPILDTLLARYIGKAALDPVQNVDGLSSVTYTNDTIYYAIDNGIKFFASKASAIRGASVAEEVTLGALADPILDEILLLFPNTTSYEEVYALDSATEKTIAYQTNEGHIVVRYWSSVTYREPSASENEVYPMSLMFKFDTAGDEKSINMQTAVPTGAMTYYYNLALDWYINEHKTDGSGSGATGSFNYLVRAVVCAEYVYKEAYTSVNATSFVMEGVNE